MLDRNTLAAGTVLSAASAAVVYHAYSLKRNFYSTTIYILRSNVSVVILASLAVFLVYVASLALKTVLFGELRLIELEHLYEYGWMTLSESFLAMTIFRNEFDTRFVMVFTTTMVIKAFHWIARDRIDFMEQTMRLPHGFDARMLLCMTLLTVADLLGFYLCAMDFVAHGPSMCILFGHEFAQMTVNLVNICIRYALNKHDLDQGATWEHRSIFLFYFDFAIDMAKLLLYASFFAIVVMYYGVPLHIIRDMFITVRSFVLRVKDIIRYRRATANMNQRYPEATQEELAQTDRICIICREEMATARRLPCNHYFHYRCLRSWLERQQSCPTCRRPILEAADGAPQPAPQGAPGEAQLRPLIWRNNRWVDGDEPHAPRDNPEARADPVYPAQMAHALRIDHRQQQPAEDEMPVVMVPHDQIAVVRVPGRVDQTPLMGVSEHSTDTTRRPRSASPRRANEAVFNEHAGRTLYILRSSSSASGPIYLEPVNAPPSVQHAVREHSASLRTSIAASSEINVLGEEPDDYSQLPPSLSSGQSSVTPSEDHHVASVIRSRFSRQLHGASLSSGPFASAPTLRHRRPSNSRSPATLSDADSVPFSLGEEDAREMRALVRRELRVHLASLTRLQNEVTALSERLASADDNDDLTGANAEINDA